MTFYPPNGDLVHAYWTFRTMAAAADYAAAATMRSDLRRARVYFSAEARGPVKL